MGSFLRRVVFRGMTSSNTKDCSATRHRSFGVTARSFSERLEEQVLSNVLRVPARNEGTMGLNSALQAASNRWGVAPQRLRPPTLRTDGIPRVGLLETLVSADVPLVVVEAGAGYGKTTLLRQWVDADPRSVAWLGLDTADNDNVIFLRHLVCSLERSGQDMSPVEESLARDDPRPNLQAMAAIGRCLDTSDQPYLLIIDDVHLLSDASSIETLQQLLGMARPGSTIALAGRSIPPLQLAKRSLDVGLLELDQDALAFTDAEAIDVVARALPHLAPSTIEELVRLTERWPAGIQLGVLALNRHPDPPVLIEELVLADDNVAEYLHEQIIDRTSPRMRTFLQQAAVLERLSVELCDSVLDRSDSARLLHRLVESGSGFIVPVEDHPNDFRLHHMSASLLLDQLRRSDPASEVPIRRRAASWYSEHGESDLAVRQALATGDLTFAAAILYQQIFPAIQRGEVASLERWIDAVPPQALHANGLLALSAGWLALTRGDRSELRHHLAIARTAPVPGVIPDGTSSYEIAVASLEMTAAIGGVKESAASAAIVRAAGPTGSPWWAMAGLIEALSLTLMDAVDPIEAFSEAEIDARGLPAVHALALAQLGVAHLRRLQNEPGQRAVRAAVDEVGQHRLEHFSMVVMVHCAEAFAAAVRGDRIESELASNRAGELFGYSASAVARGGIQARLTLTEAAIARRSWTDAGSFLREAVDLLPLEPDAVVLHGWAEDLQQRLHQLRTGSRVGEMTPAELRVLEHLHTHLTLTEIGEILFVSRNTVKTHVVSIYRKLAVTDRSEAVARARELGLLAFGA